MQRIKALAAEVPRGESGPSEAPTNFLLKKVAVETAIILLRKFSRSKKFPATTNKSLIQLARLVFMTATGFPKAEKNEIVEMKRAAVAVLRGDPGMRGEWRRPETAGK